MPKLNTTRHDDRQGSQGKTIADILNHSEQPFDALLDFSICEGRRLPIQDSETHQSQIPSAGVEQEPAASAHQRLLLLGSPAWHEGVTAGSGRCDPIKHGTSWLEADWRTKLSLGV